MLIINPSFDPADTKKIDGVVEKLLGTDAKYIKSKNIWGKKTLSYEINHLKEGVYVLYNIEAPKIDIKFLAKQAKMMNELVRYSLINV
jgi:small subunit ribosomal protein S6